MSEAIAYTDTEAAEQVVGQEVPVLDDTDAEYMLAMYRKATNEYNEAEAWYKHQLEKAKEKRDATFAWVEASLRPYFDTVPATGKKIRSYELRNGILKMTNQEPKYEVDDEEMVAWLKKTNQNNFIKVTEEAKWGDFKKTLPKDKTGSFLTVTSEDGTIQLVNEDGEIVPGVKVIPREDKFSVTIK